MLLSRRCIITQHKNILYATRHKDRMLQELSREIADILADEVPRHVKYVWLESEQDGVHGLTDTVYELKAVIAYLEPEHCKVGDLLYYPIQVMYADLNLQDQDGQDMRFERYYHEFIWRRLA